MALIPGTTTIAARKAAAQQAAAQALTLPTAQPLQAVPAATEGLLPAPATTPTPAPASTGGIYDGIWNNPDVWTQTGPGGGLLSAITPIRVSGAANTYATPDQWLMSAARPSGQSFSAAGYDGDSTFTMGADNPIRVTDLSGNVLYEGTGYDGAQAASDLTSSIVGDAGSTGYRVEGLDPYSGEWQSLAYNARPTDGMGLFMDYVLPAVGAIALPGVGGVLGGALGTGLGAAGGSIASSVAQGRALDDALLRAGISGVTAGGLSALSGTPLIPETGGAIPLSPEVAQNLANVAIPEVATSQQIAQSFANAPIPVINVTARALATTPVSGALGGAAGSGVANAGTSNPENTMIVEGTLPDVAPGASFEEAFAFLAPGVVNNPPPAETTADTADTTEGTDSEDPTGNGLLDEIMKYYTLGSFGLDALGGLLGGSGSGGTTTPYVSQLGAMPTFTRGGYQPYTGDYETYGFGPEFNFFGGPATTTPGSAASLLNPALPVNNTVVA